MFAYKLEDNTVALCRKFTSVPEGADWIETNEVPDRRHREAWRIAGGALTTNAPKKLGIERKAMIAAIREESMSRITAVIPALDTIAMVELILELWPMMDNAGASDDLKLVRFTHRYARTQVQAMRSATIEEVLAYDPTTDTGWPV